MSLGSLKGLVSSMNLDDPCSLKRLCSQDHQQLRKTRSLNHTISSQNRRSSLINPVKYGFSALRSSMKRNSTHADSDVIIHKYKDNAKDRHNNENGTDYKKDLDTCTQGQSPSWPASELQIKQDYPFSMDMFEKIEESGYDWTPNSSIVSSTVGSRSCSPCPSDGSTVVVDFDIEDHQYATHPKQPRWYAMLKRIKRRDTGNCELNKSLVADTNLSPYPSEKKRFMPTQDGESQAEKQPSDSPPKKVHNRDDDQDDRDDNASLRSRHKDQSKNASFEDCYFSCPYRKRNPRRFNVRDHSSCATKKLRGIHELKEHIRLVHRRHVCFSGPDSHPEDGITREVENILEKPARLAISDWNTLWRLLFPSDQYVPPKDFIAPIELEEVLLEFHECLDTMAVHVSQEIERVLPALHNQLTSRMILIFKLFIAEAFTNCNNKYRRPLPTYSQLGNGAVNPGRFQHSNHVSDLDPMNGDLMLSHIREMRCPLWRSLQVLPDIEALNLPTIQLPSDQVALSLNHMQPSIVGFHSYLAWLLFSSGSEQVIWNTNSSLNTRCGESNLIESQKSTDNSTLHTLPTHAQRQPKGITKGMSLGHNVLKDNDPIPSYIRPEHERRDAHIQSPKILESTEIDSGMDWDQILDVHRGENQETPTSKSASPDIIYHKPDAMAEVYIELKDDLIDDIINQTCDIIMEKVCQHGDDVDALSRIVETVVINLMNELMSVPICPSFMSYPQDAGSSPNSSSGTHHGSSSQLHSRGNSSGNNRQQRRSSGGSNDRDDADDPSAPGGNAAVDNVSRPTQPSLFSCPYRKRNPRRFNTRDHHSCAAKGWVWPFLKRHIMNSHMREGQVRMQAAFSCQRCTQGFNTSTALREHVRLNTCDYVDPPEETLGDPEDGITQSERERLKARNVNKINNWSDLWRLLFPTDQEIPSQEFVPPDNTEHIRRDLYRVRPEMEREVMAVLEEPSNIEHGMMSRADIVSQVMQAVYSCIDRTLDQNRITAPRSQASSSMSPTENHDAGDCPQISRKRARLETVQSYTSQNFNFSNQDVPYLVPENTDSASGNSGKPGPLQMSILDSQAIFQPSTQLNWEHRSSPLFAHQYQHPMSTNDHIAPHISFSPGSASGHGSGGFTPGSDTGFSPLSPICPRLVHCDCMQNDLTSNMHHPM